MRLVLAAPQLVGELWGKLEPMIEKAMPRAGGRMKAMDVLEGALEGAFDIWLVLDDEKGVVAVGAAQIVEYPQTRVYYVFLYSGERRRAMPLWAAIEAHARKKACAEIQVAGPRAWGRIFPEFREHATFFVKEL